MFWHHLQSGPKYQFLTGLFAQTAAEVDGWGSPGGGPGEAGSIFLKVGLTLFLIHVATLELWVLTPSAATLTVSIRSPWEKNKQAARQVCKYDSFDLTLSSHTVYSHLNMY